MSKFQTIIVAGMGRCGTTLLFNAIRQKNEFVRDIGNLNNPDFLNMQVIKTHDFAPGKLPENTKCIYMFGNPYEIVFSAHGDKVNHYEHYKNMHSEPSSLHKFTWQDTLNLSKNFSSWHKRQTFPLLTLRYETLWENIDVINKFLGFNISLPPKKQRQTNLHNPQFANQMYSVKATYQPLYATIQQAPDSHIWEIIKKD